MLDNCSTWQHKDKIFVFKMLFNLAGSAMDLVRRMHIERNMEDLWIIIYHVKRLKVRTTMACHVYGSK